MSVEDRHYYATCNRIHAIGSDVAKLRQALYDAKLALGTKDTGAAIAKINEALDVSQGWTHG